jgi:hydroxyethylthiazole kinase-like uncharacterized protein yjeF
VRDSESLVHRPGGRIDLPQATLCVVVAADRFGIATLHQLRGRIGRGELLGEQQRGFDELRALDPVTDLELLLAVRDAVSPPPANHYIALPVPPKPLSVAEARAIDQHASQVLGMPTLLLMENAGIAVAAAARELGSRFVVLCGPGNNGGDALVAARQLGRARCQVHVLAAPDPQRAPDAALQLAILQAAGWPVVVGQLPTDTPAAGAVWIDGLFGVGLQRPLVGEARRWVEVCNAAPGPRLAIDLPSGLHGDTGEELGAAVRADVTVTLVAEKLGMQTPSGRARCGRIVVAGLGLP